MYCKRTEAVIVEPDILEVNIFPYFKKRDFLPNSHESGTIWKKFGRKITCDDSFNWYTTLRILWVLKTNCVQRAKVRLVLFLSKPQGIREIGFILGHHLWFLHLTCNRSGQWFKERHWEHRYLFPPLILHWHPCICLFISKWFVVGTPARFLIAAEITLQTSITGCYLMPQK